MRMIDLNCRGGGALLGFRRAGYDVLFACDPSPEGRRMAEDNLGVQAAPLSIDPARVPHADVAFATSSSLDKGGLARMIDAIRPRAIIVEFAGMARPFSIRGYRNHMANLRPAEFGIPMSGRRAYAVSLRDDVRTLVANFPFPDAAGPGRTLADVLRGEAPSPELSLSSGTIDSLRRRNKKNIEQGTRFKYRILRPGDLCPPLTRYHKDGYDAIVDSGTGPRRLSIVEVKRAMGFPDGWKVPESRTKACMLLGQSSWPAVAQALAEEVLVWL